MRIPINERFFVIEIRAADRPASVEHLNDRDIYERTLRIPYPYTAADAEHFLEVVNSSVERHGKPVHFAIRDSGARRRAYWKRTVLFAKARTASSLPKTADSSTPNVTRSW